MKLRYFVFLNLSIFEPVKTNYSVEMKRYEKHIFICENKRPEGHPRGCCADKGGAELKAAFKQKLKHLNLNTKIRANTSGCLDACEHGAVVLIYPEQVWYGNVSIEDIDEIIEKHILNNQIVKRLLIKDEKFNQ